MDSRNFEEECAPNDKWLATASKEEQIAAMRQWFLNRYEDPANQTPWDGEDKEYVFVWGGPHDPNDVIQERFQDIVEFDTMFELINDLWGEVGEQWAPIQHEEVEYERDLTKVFIVKRSDPHDFLLDRITEIFKVLESSTLNNDNRLVLHQIVHGSLIAALEAYLGDTVRFWLDKDSRALRKFVATNKDFQARSLPFSDLFATMEKIKTEVSEYLRNIVWHKLYKVKTMLASGLEINVPDIGHLMKQIKVRHDIVHRAGRGNDGSLVELSEEDLKTLGKHITDFAEHIEGELVRRFSDYNDDESF